MEASYLSIADIAQLENKSIKTIRRLVAANEIPCQKVKGSNFYQISKQDYAKWKKIAKNQSQITNETEEILDVTYNESEFVDISKKMKSIDGWNKGYRNGYKFVDLFSGAGGLSCGLAMAGFEPVASVEIMENAIKTYKTNFIDSGRFANEYIEVSDIREQSVKNGVIKKAKDAGVDVIVGGFPCQGFSMAGNRIVTDPRNSLYKDMLTIVEAVSPRIVIMENVEGLRSMLNGNVEKKIIQDYQNIGYKISAHTLNAADYGVPQLRKRVIFIANRLESDETNLYPKPIYNKSNYITMGEAIEKYLNMNEDKSINHLFTRHTEDMKRRLKRVKVGSSLYENYSDAWKKTSWDEPSNTIKENHGGVNIHPKLPRVLTPREMATLQSFPDDFFFEGVKKWQLVQIGNAVPPILGKAIGLSVLEMLEKEDKK